jgi:hypothetical protein
MLCACCSGSAPGGRFFKDFYQWQVPNPMSNPTKNGLFGALQGVFRISNFNSAFRNFIIAVQTLRRRFRGRWRGYFVGPLTHLPWLGWIAAGQLERRDGEGVICPYSSMHMDMSLKAAGWRYRLAICFANSYRLDLN